jgi:hypothetical protein
MSLARKDRVPARSGRRARSGRPAGPSCMLVLGRALLAAWDVGADLRAPGMAGAGITASTRSFVAERLSYLPDIGRGSR